MALTLKIISPSTLPPGQLPEFTFDELGGTIGRKPNNDFVLIDPERFISSQHACIEFHNGKYLITDTSTNGVFINNSQRPVGSGNQVELHNGDKISIGEFQLEAELSEVAIPGVTPEMDWNKPAAASGPAAQSSNPFDFNEPLVSPASTESPDPMDPLALLDSEPSGYSSPNLNPAEISAPFSPSATPEPTPGPASDQLFDDILGNAHQNIAEPLPINEPFTPPAAIPDESFTPPPAAIPDDWDIMADDLTENNASTEFSKPVSPVSPQQPATTVDNLFPDTEFESTTPVIPPSESIFDEDDIFAALDASPAAPQTPEPAAAPVPPAQMPEAKPVAPPQPTYAAQPQATSAANNRELLDAFIKGAGLDPARIETDDPVALMTKLGQLTRISTEGLMMALRARATIKSSFRVNKTIIAPVENNPLKFSVTSEDALNIIFADEKAGYMPATEAFSEGFKDLQTHQMAMMAGMQAIIKEITLQFSPETLERKFEAQHSGSSFLPVNKKAKNWEMYEEFYKKMTETMKDDFQNVYGEEFAKAYEEQVRKLM